MKFVYDFFASLFVILTFGFCNIEVKYSDGTKYEWVGWIKLIEDYIDSH